VVLFEPKEVEEKVVEQAKAILQRGDVVAVLAVTPQGALLGGQLEGLRLRVRAEGTRLLFEEFPAASPISP
jgi:hypothetical protein